MRTILAIYFVILGGILTAQDTLSFERTYMWEYNTDSLTDKGKHLLNEIQDTLLSYLESGNSVEIKLVEEILQSSSICKSKIYSKRIESYLDTRLIKKFDRLEYSSGCIRVKDFSHLEPHFINYYILLVIKD